MGKLTSRISKISWTRTNRAARQRLPAIHVLASVRGWVSRMRLLARWLADVTVGDGHADFDASGTTNRSDISAFLSRWLAAAAGNCA